MLSIERLPDEYISLARLQVTFSPDVPLPAGYASREDYLTQLYSELCFQIQAPDTLNRALERERYFDSGAANALRLDSEITIEATRRPGDELVSVVAIGNEPKRTQAVLDHLVDVVYALAVESDASSNAALQVAILDRASQAVRDAKDPWLKGCIWGIYGFMAGTAFIILFSALVPILKAAKEPSPPMLNE